MSSPNGPDIKSSTPPSSSSSSAEAPCTTPPRPACSSPPCGDVCCECDKAACCLGSEAVHMTACGSVKVPLEAGQTYYWCRCGRSKNQPFCDGRHKGTSFTPLAFTATETKVHSICRCRQTSSPPYCDGTHSSAQTLRCYANQLSTEQARLHKKLKGQNVKWAAVTAGVAAASIVLSVAATVLFMKGKPVSASPTGGGGSVKY
eukprot:GHVQ01022035.1.p1 GENE.GHVQ01022035.1~~GHVQ01022035.1.p1  ORF type:complete len:203 (+),score=46.08 GHVQ01022035.1:670-1278(+)